MVGAGRSGLVSLDPMTGDTNTSRGTLAARARSARKPAPGELVPAAELPVARVVVDSPLSHLDRLFDYQVSQAQSDDARPGTRVRVRFAGRLIDAYLVERVETSDHVGKLGYLDRVVSAESVLSPEVIAAARSVADRYAGTLTDVLRLAVPPRHARAEGETAGVPAPAVGAPAVPLSTAGWAEYTTGPAFLHAAAAGRPARAVWQARPGEDWPTRLAEAAAAVDGAGRGVVMVVPDARDLTRLDAAMTTVLGPGRHASLAADLGPAERYRRFLAVRRGQVRVAIGTRSAVFAPVRDLGLIAVFDDGDDLLAEPRSPYPHVREVAMIRSAQAKSALMIGGFARTAEAQLLVESGWAHPIEAPRAVIRAAAPRIEAAGDDYARGADSAAAHARLTPAAFDAARKSLAAGLPVLVQVPRRGYLPSLACATCRRPARCRHCHGPLGLVRGSDTASCRWCGAIAAPWSCPACAATAFRAVVSGAGRTAEELGRAFAGVRLVTSAGDQIHPTLPSEPALVVATPGAEPVVSGGYGAALLLDGGALLGRADLRAAEETLRRWMAAATLVRPAGEGGRVVVGADSGLATVQALVRWDAAGHAAEELAARRELGFPPAVAMAAVEGSAGGVAAFLEELEMPEGAELLGPVALEHPESGERALIRIELPRQRELAAALHTASAARSARKDPEPARVRMDPLAMF
ncbi:primosomal protein N' [Nakamurella silvestris]|nr:primosomal protein N' [Nakamurella silvestris]